MKYIVFDIEANGLLETATDIHCLCYQELDSNLNKVSEGELTDKEEMKEFLSNLSTDVTLVGHNIIRYDIPLLTEILQFISHFYDKIDTLALSWYLYPKRNSHGLKSWGEEVGTSKVEIEDWSNLTVNEYVNRCREDVKINVVIFRLFMNYLNLLYTDKNIMYSVMRYLDFKMDCLKVQEANPILLDTYHIQNMINDLEFKLIEKMEILSTSMPPELGKIIKTKPANMYKKDGSLSSHGLKWSEYLAQEGITEDVEVIRDKPNPGSSTQLKQWLFSLGWKPITFKQNDKGEKIPQVSVDGDLCQSVKDLIPIEPAIEELDSLFMIRHRIGLFKGFLANSNNDRIQATAHALTQTLRFKHKNIVNLPGVYKPYGKEIRNSLIAEPGYTMVGVDIQGLEDNTKRHFLYFFDPGYVETMNKPGFDPHLDIAVLANLMSEEDAEFYKNFNGEDKEKYAKLKTVRHTAKTSNFACLYNAGPPKIAETAKIKLSEAKKLHDTYWKRNWAIKEIVNNLKVKTVNGQKWILNPVSNFWIFLSAEKDKFSALNQNTGVMVFDNFLQNLNYELKLKKPDIKIRFQYHDELMFTFNKLEITKEEIIEILDKAMKVTNEVLKLNIKINYSAEFGKKYGECH